MFDKPTEQIYEQHDWTKPGMSERTRRGIKEHTVEDLFLERIARQNRKQFKQYVKDTGEGRQGHYNKSHPVRSTAKKYMKEYAEDDTKAHFKLRQDHPDYVNKKIELEALGATVETIEVGS